MSTAMQLLVLIPIAYLLGSVPFGLLVGLAKGIDVRKGGSGNIGATNVGRLLGGRYFALVFTLDLLKGLLPAVAGSWIVLSSRARPDTVVYLLWLGAGFSAIFGHMFSAFMRFRGGKGVATSAGVILGTFPYYTLTAAAAIGAWAICFAITRIVSLSSMVGSCIFPIAYAIIGWRMGWEVLGQRWPLLAFAILTALLVVWKHRSNISRLLAGTEMSFKKGAPRSGN